MTADVIPLASVNDVVVGPVHGGGAVVDGVSFAVRAGRVLGLVGRSGSGKTTAALTLLGHLRPGLALRAGRVQVAGLDPFSPAARLRGRVVSYLGQDPVSALNPARRLGAQLAEAVRLRTAMRESTVDGEVAGLLGSVGLPADRAFLRRFSHQVSGGQAQRVALAIALSGAPRLLVLDEPTSGLDTVVAAGIRGLLADLLGAGGTAAVLVSHDPHLVAELADDVVELADGRIRSTSRPAAVIVPAGTAPARMRTSDPRLEIEQLSARHGRRTAVDDVSMAVARGSALALVGPSGSGKSTIARSVIGLHPPSLGRVTLDGEPLAGHYRGRTPAQRRAIQLVAQDAVGALNPRETVEAALRRPLRRLRGLSERDTTGEILALLDRVHLPAACADRRPGELSGGERQRVNLCRALAAAPKVLVCDEVTSALDREIGSAVLGLLDELRTELGLTVLLITHDLAVAATTAQNLAVLNHGRILETGPTSDILRAPTHDLTRSLVNSCPALSTALPVIHNPPEVDHPTALSG